MPAAPIYIISALLFMGAAPLPYGYYMLLRIAVTGFCIWATVVTYEQKSQYLPWVFVLLALLFNPIIKIHLAKELWALIDVGVAIFILLVRQNLLDSKRGSR